MFKFIGKILLFILFITLIISTTALGVLYVIKNNDYTKLNDEKKTLSDNLSASEGKIKEYEAAISKSSKLDFIEENFNIKITYPSDWTVKSKVDITEGGVYPDIKNYIVGFQKQSTNITFTKFLAATGTTGIGYPTSKYDIKVLSDKLFRYSEKGSSKWSYGSKVSCSDISGVIDIQGADVCGSSFFPGFGDKGANFVNVDMSSSTNMDEVDAIVLSAVK
jgi:archaellum component FlaF (FlaF/FlaG flagellin family)